MMEILRAKFVLRKHYIELDIEGSDFDIKNK
jgi:hypothetical protein